MLGENRFWTLNFWDHSKRLSLAWCVIQVCSCHWRHLAWRLRQTAKVRNFVCVRSYKTLPRRFTKRDQKGRTEILWMTTNPCWLRDIDFSAKIDGPMTIWSLVFTRHADSGLAIERQPKLQAIETLNYIALQWYGSYDLTKCLSAAF